MSNFVDYVKIHCKSGHGGAGSAHLRREKYIPKGGPDGGDGGRGGHIIMKGNAHEWTLLPLRYTRHIKAENGQPGGKNQLTGRFGEDVYIEVPIGTIAKNEDGEVIGEILEDGQEIILMQGGKGGLGNEHFKSATNQTPRYAQPGLPGEEGYIVFELKVLADVGLVGFPNAGKSTLLASVSAAKPKIADYAFTTLTPNLGIVEYRNYKSFVMADIPGIIEGAAEGKGLGHRFLRHIERNRILAHVFDLSGSEGRDPLEDIAKVDSELARYSERLLEKPRILVANKADITLDKEAALERIKKAYPEMELFVVSGATGEGLKELMQRLSQILRDLPQEDYDALDEIESLEEVTITLEDKGFNVVQIDENTFEVLGEEIVRLVQKTQFDYDESVNRFLNIINKMGVEDELRKLGVKEGDTVIIGPMALDYFE